MKDPVMSVLKKSTEIVQSLGFCHNVHRYSSMANWVFCSSNRTAHSAWTGLLLLRNLSLRKPRTLKSKPNSR